MTVATLTTLPDSNVSAYVRTRNGESVHRVGCWHLARVKTAVPWNWAEGRSLNEIIDEMAKVGIGPYHFCGWCFGDEGGDRP